MVKSMVKNMGWVIATKSQVLLELLMMYISKINKIVLKLIDDFLLYVVTVQNAYA